MLLLYLVTCSGSLAATNHAIWVISDIHLDSSTTHVMQLAPKSRWYWNDLDPPTFQQLLRALRDGQKQAKIPSPAAILLLGDLVGHQRTRPDAVKRSEQACFQALAEYFPGVPVLYTFGNNDSLAANYGPFASTYNPFLSTHTVCSAHSARYPCLLTQNSQDGYYSGYLFAHLRLISLNSVMFSPRATGVSARKKAQQMQWLSAQLAEVKLKHEQALLVMHIPPGQNVYDGQAFWRAELARQFLALLIQHASSIVGVLAAHTHKDEIKVVLNAAHQPLAGVFLNAALSTAHGNAPGVRVYQFDQQQEQWRLTNYTSYFFTPLLRKLYDFRHVYCKTPQANMPTCLKGVSVEKMARYFSAGNPNFHERVTWPQAMHLSL